MRRVQWVLPLLFLAALAAKAAALEPDPIIRLSPEQRARLAQYSIPQDEQQELLKRKADLSGVLLGLGAFQHLYPKMAIKGRQGENVVYAGSGYDYVEDVLKGVLQTGLFDPAQVGISNFPPNERWKYVASAQWIGSAGARGIRYSVVATSTGKAIVSETLPLPPAWDTYHPTWAPSVREDAMTRFGAYLAFKTAKAVLEAK